MLHTHQSKRQCIRRKNFLNDCLHKLTHWLVEYCNVYDIRTVVLGDITDIREDNDMGNAENQKFHGRFGDADNVGV